jgi:thiamine biosynthesis lipoprotein
MVEIGGEVVTRGHNPHGQPWRIGVNKPVEDPENVELQAVLQVDNAALATSGNYRNFYYKGGRKYAHTIDPRTGYPVQHELLSATVIAKQCAVADAYATSFMVLGLEKSKALLQRHPELKAYFIYTDEQGKLAVWHTDGLTIEDN